jgi:hypothetical protein
MTIAASSAGGWGNTLRSCRRQWHRRPGDEFRLTIRQGGVVAETFDNLSMNPDALNFAELVVNASSRLVRVTVAAGNDSTTAGTSSARASAAIDAPVDRRKFRINLNADGPQTLTLATQ